MCASQLPYRLLTLVALCASAGCGDDDGPAMGADAGAADAGASVAASQQGLTLTLADGKLKGELIGGDVRRFLKIPFAKAPVGELRWKPPVATAPWRGVRYETEFNEACAQSASAQGPASANEDCLYLNVWTPDPAPQDAPVMVWFHGGGNFAGSEGDKLPNAGASAPLWYDGQFFAREQGVVLVTVDYRLGPLGFFAHPALAQEGSALGNQGLLDQQMSLSWVKKNIAAFGGDPGNVTIFGESAGSADVCFHVVSPKSRGLFHRAISQSGGCTAGLGGPRDDTTADGVKAGLEAYAAALGCDDADTVLECLREVPVADLLATATQPDPVGGMMAVPNPWSFNVVIDGDGGFVPDRPALLFLRGEVAKVPYLLGSNTDEGTLFVLSGALPTTDAEYEAALQARFGDIAQDVLAQYPASDFGGDHQAALARVVGDAGLVCGTHDSARRAAKAGLPVFMYNFNIPWAIAAGALKAAHASEISHVFGNPFMPTDADVAVSRALNTYWATFALTGDPNYPGAPAKWPAFEPDASDNDQRLQLDPDFAVLDNFRKEACAFWRTHYTN